MYLWASDATIHDRSRSDFGNLFGCRWHHSTGNRCIFTLEIIAHLLHCDPFDTLVAIDVFNDSKVMSENQKIMKPQIKIPFVHQKNVGTSANIGVDGHWEDELVILAVIIVEVILENEISSRKQCVEQEAFTLQMSSMSLGLTQP